VKGEWEKGKRRAGEGREKGSVEGRKEGLGSEKGWDW
jgi:hypothetical protein